MTDPQTFLFADLAGFTALTEAHGDERAADLVADFCRRARDLLPDYESEEVKAIGDALMIRSADAAQGVRLALELTTGIGAQHGFPALRIGVHTGPAVERSADWFGAAVNLASRVSGAAEAGEVLVTAATRDVTADALPALEFRYLGAKRFKNVREPIEVYSVAAHTDIRPRSVRPVVDPVCRMTIDPVRAHTQRKHRGVDYRFCSAACAEAFDADPDHYHGHHSSRSHLRVSDGSRERSAAFLRRAYRRGRIDQRELEDRLAHIFAARTRGELSAVLGDLPGSRRLRRSGGRRRLVGLIRRLWRRLRR